MYQPKPIGGNAHPGNKRSAMGALAHSAMAMRAPQRWRIGFEPNRIAKTSARQYFRVVHEQLEYIIAPQLIRYDIRCTIQLIEHTQRSLIQ